MLHITYAIVESDSIFEHGVVAMDCYFSGILIPKVAALEAFGKIGDQ